MQRPYGMFPGQSTAVPNMNQQSFQQIQHGQQVPTSAAYNVQQGLATPGMGMQGNMQQGYHRQPFAGNIQPFHANMQQHQMQQLLMQQFPGQMQQFGGNVQQYGGNMQPFMGNTQQMPMNITPQQQMMMGGMGGSPAPPPYNSQMSKDFKAKQAKMQKEQMKMMEKQKKQMEQEIKHRQFQETQKRLKEFSAIGGRKMDVDSAIHSIIGSSSSELKPTHSQSTYPTRGPGHPVVNTSSVVQSYTASPQDDDFSDFKSAPVSQTVPVNQVGVSHVNQNPTIVEDDFADFKSAPTVVNEELSRAGVSPNQNSGSHPPQPAGKKKDLMAMMMQCSDLTNVNEPRNLKFKPSVKDIHPTHVKRDTFLSSDRARHWSYSEQEQLSDLFISPQEQVTQQPKVASPTSKLQPSFMVIPSQAVPSNIPTSHTMPSAGGPPHQGVTQGLVQGSPSTQSVAHGAQSQLKWYEDGSTCRMPDVYYMVLQACSRENVIDANLLHPILLRSSLDKSVLGKLWALCNKQTPGQLTPHELFMLLAMISAAQNKMAYDSLDILKHCPFAPIPNLGQHGTDPTQSATSHNQAPQPQHGSSPVQSQAVHQHTTPTSTVSNQAMPIAAVHYQSTPTSTVSHQATPTAVAHTHSTSMKQDDFADFQAFNEPSNDDDDFADFKQAPPSLPEAVLARDLIGQSDVYDALRFEMPVTPVAETRHSAQPSSKDEFADFASFSDSASNSDNKLTDFSSNTDSNAQSDLSSTAQSVNSDVSWTGFSSMGDTPSTNQSSVLSFESTISKPESRIPKPLSSPMKHDHEFGDFISKPVAYAAKSGGTDKLSAIKALIMDQKLYSDKPKETNFPVTLEEKDLPHPNKAQNDDWDPFVGSSNKQGITMETTQSKLCDFVTSQSKDSNKESEGWADFAAAPEVVQNKTEFGSFHKHKSSTEDSGSDSSAKNTDNKIKVDPKKAYGIFSHNMQLAHTKAVGMSALDTEPPEIPDFPDKEDHEHGPNFDKFGTFQGHPEFDLDSHSAGISSLVTPYGGFDDLMEPMGSQNARKTGTMTDSQSTSSFEFTGWGNVSKGLKEDTQSMKSLELKQLADSQEGSPDYGDSQSVSSLELPAEPMKKIIQSDTKSVASLDLRPETEEEQTAEQTDKQTDLQPQTKVAPKPKAGIELLTQGGEAPTFGDRYGALFDNEPQDSEKHVYAWEKCLTQAKSMIQQANDTLNNISSMEVCKEVMESEKGSHYLQSVTEIYRVSCRIKTAMHGLSLNTNKLDNIQKDVHNCWNNLVSFLSSTSLMPSAQSLSFKKALRKDKSDNITDLLCGVCLLDVAVANDDSSANEKAGHKLSYGGREYHTTCANFWVNCIDHTLPALKIPELI